jgi:hypothetical protein
MLVIFVKGIFGHVVLMEVMFLQPHHASSLDLRSYLWKSYGSIFIFGLLQSHAHLVLKPTTILGQNDKVMHPFILQVATTLTLYSPYLHKYPLSPDIEPC